MEVGAEHPVGHELGQQLDLQAHRGALAIGDRHELASERREGAAGGVEPEGAGRSDEARGPVGLGERAIARGEGGVG